MRRLATAAVVLLAACHDFDAALSDCIDAGQCTTGGSVPMDAKLVLDVSGASEIDFMDVPLGSSRALAVPIKNTGDRASSALTVMSPGSEFAVTTDGCGGQVLGGHVSCMLTVTFTPAVVGARSATLAVKADTGGTVLVTLRGNGTTAAALTLTPNQLDFGPITINKQSASQRITVKNTGTQAALNLGVALSGMSTQFVTVGNTCATTLSGGGSCDVDLQFKPTMTGMLSAQLDVTADQTPAAHAPVAGQGLAVSDLALMPGTYDFGALATGRSASKQFTVQNTGTVTTGALNVQIVGANASQYSVTAGCTNLTLNAGESCMFNVVFAPTALGSLPATVEVSGSPGGMSPAQLSGIGLVPAAFIISPAAATFGPIDAGLPVTRGFRLMNTGQETSDVAAFSFTQLKPDFTVDAGTCAGVRLAGDAGCTFGVTFLPAGWEDTMGQVVASAQAGGTASVAVHALGLADYRLSVTVAPARGGTVVVGDAGTCSFGTCNFVRTGGTSEDLTLTNLPSAWSLVAWSGDCSGDAGCSLSYTQDHAVTATFAGSNHAFVTSATFTGALGGLDGGDAICNAAAVDAGLPGVYRAWLSQFNPNISAPSRLADAGASSWVLTNGKPQGIAFAATVGDLLSAHGPLLYAALNVTEHGAAMLDGAPTWDQDRVWTGTQGTGQPASDCNHWLADAGSAGGTGLISAVDSTWTYSGPFSACDSLRHLYCFDVAQPSTPMPARPAPAGGRYAFVSSTLQNGAADFDGTCANLAADAGLPGKYLAFRSTSTQAAGRRFIPDGGWYRTDGRQFFTANPADLVSDAGVGLRQPLNLTERGLPVQLDAGAVVWTGNETVLRGPGDPGTNNCSNWTNDGGGPLGATGGVGDPSQLSAGWWGGDPFSGTTSLSCGSLAHVYCFQQ